MTELPELDQESVATVHDIRSLVYTVVHLGDPLIALESLYRYLRKFHALGDQRYVMATLTQVVPLLIVLLSLEFVPRRRRLTKESVAQAS